MLFVSGDGGWNLGVIAMAGRLAAKGAVVAGMDIRHYLGELEKSAEQCVAPASDLEDLSRELQSKLGLKRNLQPTLVGYSSGRYARVCRIGRSQGRRVQRSVESRLLSRSRSEEAVVLRFRHRSDAAPHAQGDVAGRRSQAGENALRASGLRCRVSSIKCVWPRRRKISLPRFPAARSSCCRRWAMAIRWKKIGCRSMRLRSIESRPRRLPRSIDERLLHTANWASIFCATSRIFGRNCSTAVRSGTAVAA